MIMFAPTGRVDWIISGQHVRCARTAPCTCWWGAGPKWSIRSPPMFRIPEIANLADPSSLWITISQRTGSVTTSDNIDTSSLPAATPVDTRVVAARDAARASVQKGGR